MPGSRRPFPVLFADKCCTAGSCSQLLVPKTKLGAGYSRSHFGFRLQTTECVEQLGHLLLHIGRLVDHEHFSQWEEFDRS